MLTGESWLRRRLRLSSGTWPVAAGWGLMGRNGGMGGVMVRAVVLSNFDGLGGVDVREFDEPVVTDDGVLIRVVYAALGPWDVATTHGAFVGAGGGNGLPQVLGWDFAGIVESVGSQVSGFTPGERVLGFSPQPWSGIGALAELIAVPAGMIAAVPTGLDLPAAAALPVSGLTAILTLDSAAVESADTVLVVGATGGVGGFVTQLAQARRARVIASVAASAADAARELGASEVVDRDGDLAGQIKELVGPGVDVTIDLVGPRVWPAELAATRDGGRFVTTTPAAVPRERDITATSVGVQPDPSTLASLAQACAQGQLVSRVARIVPLDQAVDALAALERGRAKGKVVVNVAEAAGADLS
jgi:NADPH:quinone reductase